MDFVYSVIIVFSIILLIGYLIFTQFVIVESETEWIVDRLGKDRVLKEGINRFIPYLDRREAIVDMREMEIDPPAQEIITRDNIKLIIDVIATIRVVDSLKAVKSVEDYQKVVESAIIANVFSTLGNKRLEDIQKNVDSITEEIKEKGPIERVEIDGVYRLRVLELRIWKPPKSGYRCYGEGDSCGRRAQEEHQFSRLKGDLKVAELKAVVRDL